MKNTYCLDCDQNIRLDKKVAIGTIVRCPSCEAEFQVIDTDPVEIDWTYDSDTDWGHKQTGNHKSDGEEFDDYYSDDEELDDEESNDKDSDSEEWSWMIAKNRRMDDYGHLHDRRQNRKGHNRRDHEYSR